ncbi:putative peptidoglycan lipid II flippase [Tepidamorphus gemmatus]|uniref:Probable lipid II flippase MurJ n=1 Tax=Tepidamorphus gemmatus TaxID=747076 RepID=A0A4R3MJN6_9HYPH|nr:murein biosynthesis integral membrane protein MurJ [Tepidamorphus gemmatus]TCT11965.1 putative peptidoglycan lipid II flippase [Tepidamorphus gemmatus]
MSLLRNFATVSGGTATSRLLGFIRDVMMAAGLGTGPVADAFLVAFRFPNLFRRIFAEGAFNSAFIPLFAKSLEGQGAKSARQFAEEALSALLFTLLVLTAAAEIAMAPLMLVMAPGFVSDPDKFDLAVLLSRICFPYLLFISLVALLSGVLNALGRFAAAAFASALLNFVLIAFLAAIFWLGLEETPRAGIWLAWGVFVAGVCQLVMLVVASRRAGMGLAIIRPRLTPGVRRLIALGIPAVVTGGITQINIVVGTVIASLREGAVSYLYYADRIYQLPLGIVGTAIGVVLLPELARRLRAGDDVGVQTAQNRAFEFTLALTLPAACALILVATPIIRGLFERGAFDPADTRATAQALAAFALGLPAFVLGKVFQPAFFAREDTRTPMWFAGINAAANIVLSLALFPVLAHVGIALATSIAGWIHTGLLAGRLWRDGYFVADGRLKSRALRAIAATAIMAAVLLLVEWLLRPFSGSGRDLANAMVLAALVAAGGASYALAAMLTGVLTREEFARALGRRRTGA